MVHGIAGSLKGHVHTTPLPPPPPPIYEEKAWERILPPQEVCI